MTKELIFHLGDRKTGSTSIQAALRSHNWEAEGAPNLGYAARLNNAGLASQLTGNDPVGSSKAGFALLAKRIAALGPDNEIAVVSSEHFEIVPPNNLKQALLAHMPEYFETARFVLYVRPHADRILSSYAERVKLGVFSGPLGDYVDSAIAEQRFQYLGRVRRWQKIFGDRLVVRPMIRAHLFQNCVVRDFLSIALKTESLRLLEEPAANESLSVRDLAMLTVLHRELKSMTRQDKSRQALGRNLGLLLAALPIRNSARPAYDHSLCEKVIATHRADAEALDNLLFSGTPMTDALLSAQSKVVEPMQPSSPEDIFNDSELRDLQVWARMIARMAEIEPEGWVKFFTDTRVEEEHATGKTSAAEPVHPKFDRAANQARRAARRLQQMGSNS